MIKIVRTLHKPREVQKWSFESFDFAGTTCLMAMYEMLDRGHKMLVELGDDGSITIRAKRPSGVIGKTISFTGRPEIMSFLRRRIATYRKRNEFASIQEEAATA